MATLALAERFWSKVARGAAEECWPWLAHRFPSGYGMLTRVAISPRRVTVYAHRVAWELSREAHAKLTEEGVRDIRAQFAAGVRQSDLARAFGIRSAALNEIVHRITWKHVP